MLEPRTDRLLRLAEKCGKPYCLIFHLASIAKEQLNQSILISRVHHIIRYSGPPLTDTLIKMLIIPLKVPVRCDLKEPLARWLDDPKDDLIPADPMEYVQVRPNLHAADCRSDLIRLASLRNCLSDAFLAKSHKVALSEGALADGQEYHAALVQFEEHGFLFPDHSQILRLEWTAAASATESSNLTETYGSLTWERACIVWNLAALESFLASRHGGGSTASADLDERQEYKLCVKHSQNAATLLRFLRETLLPGCDDLLTTADFSLPSIQFWESVTLAQAQVAALEMAARSETPRHTLLSYLAMGAVSLWNEALTHGKDPLVTSHHQQESQEWGFHCKAWSMYWTTRAEYHQSLASRISQEWGMELAWLQQAQGSVQALDKFINGNNKKDMPSGSSHLVQLVNNLTQKVNDRQKQADTDNRTTYGERVPNNPTPIRPQQLVKSSPVLPEAMTSTRVALFQN